jgi:enoyl-[acyl-carrier protein] reductase II
MLKTAVCDLFGIRYPIIQGGMTHLATAELVSAVSSNGGLGVIAAGNYEAEWLRQQIKFTRSLTDKPFGVNLYLKSPLIKQQLQVIFEEKIGIVTTGAGNPHDILSILRNKNIKTMVVVGSLRSAIQAGQAGADTIVAEGKEAGGHIGRVATRVLVNQIMKAINLPVVAAGGIADGKKAAEMLALGVQGVQMGTRFICSEECVAHEDFKKRIISSGFGSTVVIGALKGSRTRCLANRFTTQYRELEKGGATLSELEIFSHGRLYKGMIEGDLDEGCLMAGESAEAIKDIQPVKLIFESIVT